MQEIQESYLSPIHVESEIPANPSKHDIDNIVTDNEVTKSNAEKGIQNLAFNTETMMAGPSPCLSKTQ